MQQLANKRRVRGFAASAVAVASLTGLAACADSAGPEEGVTVDDLQALRDDITALEDRVSALEEEPVGGADAENEFWRDPASLVGKKVTVSGEVSGLIATKDAAKGSAFRIAGDIGEPIAVVSTKQPSGLQRNDVVQVTGMVVQIQRKNFEQDFGVAEDELFENPDAFFEDFEEEYAISATSIETIQGQN